MRSCLLAAPCSIIVADSAFHATYGFDTIATSVSSVHFSLIRLLRTSWILSVCVSVSVLLDDPFSGC